MAITGDKSKLAAMRASVIKAAGIAARVAPAMAPKFRDFVRAEFATKTDPYGAAWKPIKALTLKRGTKSALDRTGRMMQEIDYLPFGTRVKVILGTFYARFHISTGRRTLPKPGQLPDLWSAAIETETEKQLRELAGGKP